MDTSRYLRLLFWGSCSTLKVMNYRKDHIVEHIRGYVFFLTAGVWDVSGGEGWIEGMSGG